VPRQAVNEMVKVQQSLASLDMTADEIRLIRPPLPQIQFLPPTMGYGDPSALSIDDCFRASRDNMQRNDFSGESGSYSASSTPSNGVW
jgi:hypothetical protein